MITDTTQPIFEIDMHCDGTITEFYIFNPSFHPKRVTLAGELGDGRPDE